MSETPQIFSLIPKVMADIGAVGKTRQNQSQNYKFRGIEDFYYAAHPAMVKHGVFCCPEIIERQEYRFLKTNAQTGAETTWLHVTVRVRHRFYAPDGSYVDVITPGEGLDNSDKGSNKAMSGAMKYALIELFSIPTEDIEDADRTTPEQGVKPKPVPVSAAPVRVQSQAVKLPVGGGQVGGTLASRSGPAEAVGSGEEPSPSTASTPDTAFPTARKYITKEQCGTIAKRFRESLREKLQPMSEALRHDALRVFGYIDDFGNPTSEVIPADEYIEAGQKLIGFAKGL